MVGIVLGLDLLIKQLVSRCRTLVTQAGNVVKCINRQAIAVSTIPDSQLERSINVALLPVSADEQILLTLAAIRQAVDQPGVRVEVEDARYIVREDGLVLVRLETMRVLVLVDKFEEVHNVYEADLELRQVCAQQRCRGQGFVCRHITARCHDNVRLLILIVTCPFPDTNALCTMGDSLLHGEVLEMLLLVGNNDVDVVFATKAVVHCREQAVGVWWEVDTDNLGTLVRHYVEEAWVLMRESVMILSPDSRSKQNVERSNLLSPFDFETLLNPLAVLVDHGVNDVNERLVAVEQTVPSGENVAL